MNTLEIGHYWPMSPNATMNALALPVVADDNTDGRSGWEWIRLADGTLFVGFRPMGEGYFMLEGDQSDDYYAAEQAGTIYSIEADVENDYPEEVIAAIRKDV